VIRALGVGIYLRPLSLFFRFVVLVTVHLYDSLWTGSLTFSLAKFWTGFHKQSVTNTGLLGA
jgi:hypothetical protein